MKSNALLGVVLAAGLVHFGSRAAAQTPDSLVGVSSADITYAVGADLSFLKSAEDRGVEFKDGGVVRPGLDIFRDHGYNWIRLRLFHSPTRLPNDLEYTIDLARQARERGFRFLLDYHYADSWADPGQQWPPAAWDTTDIDVAVDSVFQYTRSTIEAFREAGVMPEMVQIGNEVRNGMIWPLGRLPEHWDNFARLFKAGLDGIDAGRGQAPRPLIMLHYDQGADTEGTKRFFDTFHRYDIPYDIIGLSYYPWWHGSLIELRDNVLSILESYPDKDVIVVEVGYRPREYDEDELAPFPDDAPGGPRRAFLEAVNETLLGISSRRVKGIFWWEPASGCGRDYFDEECNARPVITVFDRFMRN
jgi:arabinogalactan endo-1,4-beta-galactosidase